MHLAERKLDNHRAAYVRVYEKLYGMLTDGATFPVGSKLPSEPKLAAMLGVSRMTLRQALALLHEDGLVQKIQGKGNFVTDGNKPMVSSLERMGSPVYKCSRVVIDQVETDFRLEPPTQYEQEIFIKPTAVSVAADRWYRCGEELVAYTLSLMPIETISKIGIDLNDKEQLFSFLERGMYEYAARTHLVIQPTYVGTFISEKYVMSEDEEMILFLENVYGEDDYAPLVCNKHYMKPQHCSIEINTIK